MIGLPYNVPLMPQIMPNQSVPVQTTQNNFQPFQPPQPIGQQMQTTPSFAFPTNPQDPFKQPFYQLHQADVLVANQQYTPNLLPPKYPYLPTFQTQPPISPIVQTQQPSYNPLPQNVLDQIRNTISSAAPIFILPSGCHQATNQPSNAMNRESVTQQTDFNRPACYPPSFYPYPIPIPMYDPFGLQTGCKDGPRSCSCCHKKRNTLDSMNYPLNCCCNVHESEEHRCTATIDDTICSKRNCPSSISLQALASQLLSVPGIISCALTRLILRKVPGSNITNTMEDIMEKAQKSIGGLNKDQLLVESRNAQQVNALINLHMTTTPPANIIPLLTLLQLKVNVLKAQVENLINKKVMECQGYGFDVETSGPIDPTVLTMKTNAELRQLLSALRQKECDERVNTNFSPYHSQRVIAEARLNNVQAKIRQVEAEFERRRCMTIPTPTLTSRIVQQFSESRCMFGFAHANIFEPYVQGSTLDSPDPFTPCLRNPRKLYLKPREPGPGITVQNDGNRTTSEGTSMCKDTGTVEGTVNTSEDKDVESKSSADTCSCEGTSSEESLGEDKKKLRLKIDEAGKVTISYDDNLRDVSLLKLAPNVATKFRKVCKKGRGRGRRVKEVKRVSEEKEEVDQEIEEVDKEVDPRDKLYAKKESIESGDYELFIFEEGPDDADTDSEDYELFIFEEDPDDKDIDRKDVDDETQIRDDIKKEPESIQGIRILDSIDTPIKKESESVEIIEIRDSIDTPIKKEPESIEIIEIRDSIGTPIKKESESVEIIEIRDSTDIPAKKKPEIIEVIEIRDSTDMPIKKEPETIEVIEIRDSTDIPIKKERETLEVIEIRDSTDIPIKKEPESVKANIPTIIITPVKEEPESKKEIKTDVDVPIKEEPKVKDEEKKSPQYTTEKSMKVGTHVAELYVEPKVKAEAEKTERTEFYIYVNAEPEIESTTTTAAYVEPEIKTQPPTQVIQVKADSHVKTTPTAVVSVEPPVKSEERKQVPHIKTHRHVKKRAAEKLHVEPTAEAEDGKQQKPSHRAPKVKTETITLVPQIKTDRHVKKRAAEKLHVEPTAEAEDGKQQKPSHRAPKVKTETITLVPQIKTDRHVKKIAAEKLHVEPPAEAEDGKQQEPSHGAPKVKTETITLVPQIKTVPRGKEIAVQKLHVEPTAEVEDGKQQEPSHGAPKVKTETITLIPQIKTVPRVKKTSAEMVQHETATLHIEPQAKAGPVTIVPQMKAGPVTIVPQMKAEPVTIVPQMQAGPVTIVPQMKAGPVTVVPQTTAVPHVEKTSAEMVQHETATLHIEPQVKAGPVTIVPQMKAGPVTIVPQMKAGPVTIVPQTTAVPHVKKTTAEMVQHETATLHMEPQAKAGPVTIIPQMKTGPVTIVPQTTTVPHVKKIPAEMLHVEPAEETEDGKPRTVYVVPKMKTHPRTLGIPLNVPQMVTEPQTETATLHMEPKAKARPVTMVPQAKAGPVTIVPQMKTGPVTIVPQTTTVPHVKKIPAEMLHVEPAEETEDGKTGTVYVVPKMKTQPRTLGIPLNVPQMVTEPQTETATLHMEPKAEARPVTMVPQAKAGPVTIVPQMKAGPVTIVPQAKAVPHVKKIPAEMLHVEPAEETEDGKSGTIYVVPKMKTQPRTLGIPLNVPQMVTEPQTETATLHMEPKAKARPVTMVPQAKAGPVTIVPQMKAGPVTIVPQAKAVPHVKKIPAEMLHVEPAGETEGGTFFAVPMMKGEQELTNLEGNEVLETRESWKTRFEKTRRKFEGGLKEDVSKNKKPGSKAVAQPRTSEAGRSSDLQETTFYMIKPKATKKKVIRVVKKENGPSNQENDGSQKQNNKEKNVQFVSMMTRVEYNKRFGDLWGCNIYKLNSKKIYGSSKNDPSQDTEKINSINEDRTHSPTESINPSIDNQQCESATLINSEIRKNTLVEKMFPKVPRKSDKKLANGLSCFPPLKRTESKSATSEATFSHKKTESSASKTIWNSSIFHRSDSKTENSIVSRIYSMLENQFLSFSSLFNNIPNIEDLMSTWNFNKLSGNTLNENNPNQQTSNTENNKRELNEKDDWILFPSATRTRNSDERATSGGRCVSSYEGCRNVRKIKRSIIVDKEKDNYIVIGGSNSSQLRELSRNGFKRPDKVRRSLIIRSRLKNPGNSKKEYSRPFTVFRRLKKSKESLSEGVKQTERKLEFREKLVPLPEATKALETVDVDNLNDNKENDGHAEESQEAVFQENSKHDNDLNNNCIDTSIDRTSTRSDD